MEYSVVFMFKAAEYKTRQVVDILEKALSILGQGNTGANPDKMVRGRYDKVLRTKIMYEIIKDEYKDFTERVKNKISENK